MDSARKSVMKFSSENNSPKISLTIRRQLAVDAARPGRALVFLTRAESTLTFFFARCL